jgi:hypothetical protein
MLTNWHTLLEIALRTTVIYGLVLVGIRLTGKREVGQMTPFNLTLLLLLSNSVQNAMTGPDTSLLGGAVAALVLLVLNYLLAEVSGLNRRFRRVIQVNPLCWYTTEWLSPATWPRSTCRKTNSNELCVSTVAIAAGMLPGGARGGRRYQRLEI